MARICVETHNRVPLYLGWSAHPYRLYRMTVEIPLRFYPLV
jgi:hypothetical protein